MYKYLISVWIKATVGHCNGIYSYLVLVLVWFLQLLSVGFCSEDSREKVSGMTSKQRSQLGLVLETQPVFKQNMQSMVPRRKLGSHKTPHSLQISEMDPVMRVKWL